MRGIDLLNKNSLKRQSRPATEPVPAGPNAELRAGLSISALMIGGASFGNIVLPSPVGALAGAVFGLAAAIVHRVRYE